MKIPIHIKKYIEGELMDYPLNKKALAHAKQNLYLQHSANGYADLTRGGVQVDSTVERKVMDLMADRNIIRLENSVKAVEDVLAALSPEYSRLIELKYFKPCSNQFVADELNISLRTFYYWRDHALGLFAIRSRLI